MAPTLIRRSMCVVCPLGIFGLLQFCFTNCLAMFAVLLFVLVNFDAYNGPGVMNHEILKTKLESCFITRYFGFIA